MNKLKTVMIVEDEELIAADLENRLEALGYQVSAIAANSKDALDALLLNEPAVVLMDINLKGSLDGIETAMLVKNKFDIPVVFLTAHRDRSTFDRANDAEPFGYIEKPAKDRDLIRSIEIACSQHKSKGELRLREAWLEAQLTSVGVGLVVADHAGIIRFVNTAAEELLGISPQLLVGRDFHEAVLLEDAVSGRPAKSLFRQAVLHGKTMDLGSDFCLRSATGERHEITGNIALSRFCGEIIGMIFTFRDASVPLVARDTVESKIVWQPPQLFFPTSFDLNGIVEQTRLEVSRDLPGTLSLDVSLASTERKLYGDSAVCKQIVDGLVASCRKCLPFGGGIQIRTEDIAFERRQPDGKTLQYLRLNVSCSGPGMNPGDLFGGGEDNSQRTAENCGLAALCSAVRGFNGSVRTLQRGGKFLFEVVLPCESANGSPAKLTGGTLAKPSVILLLEPDSRVRISLSTLLEAEQYEVLGATDAEELLDWHQNYGDEIAVLMLSEEAYNENLEMVQTMLAERPFTSVLLVAGDPKSQRKILAGTGRKFHRIEKLFSTSLLSATLRKLVDDRQAEISGTQLALCSAEAKPVSTPNL